MDGNWITILTCILSSTLATAIVTSAKDIILAKMKRREVVEDKKDTTDDQIKLLHEKYDKQHTELVELRQEFNKYIKDHQDVSDGIVRSNKLIMREKIEYLCQKYISKGEVTYEARKFVHEMWKEYHFTWNGNGDLDLLMDTLDNLPLAGSYQIGGEARQ